MRKQKEDKGILGGVTRISVAEGGGSKKKQDNVERDLKLQCRRETKVKLGAANGGRTLGKCTKHCQSGTTGEAAIKADFPGQLPWRFFYLIFLKKYSLHRSLMTVWPTVVLT